MASVVTNSCNGVAFFAYLQTSQSNITGDTTSVTLKCDTVDVDTANGYSVSTGIYTVPVTGRYMFFSQILYSGTFTLINFIDVVLGVPGTRTAKANYNFTAGTYNTSYSVNTQIILSLTAGASVSVSGQANGAASKVISFNGNGASSVQSTFFGGKMIL